MRSTDTPNRTVGRLFTGFVHGVIGEIWMTTLLGVLAWLGSSQNAIFLVPPFGASLAILLYLPEARIAKPLPVICGSVGGAVLGAILAVPLGTGPSTAVVAGLTAALVLTALKVFHPPGVALAMYPALMHVSPWFPLEVVLPFTLVAVLSAPLARRRPDPVHDERRPNAGR